jgi:ABC-type multidrug transport system ATPase subunit
VSSRARRARRADPTSTDEEQVDATDLDLVDDEELEDDGELVGDDDEELEDDDELVDDDDDDDDDEDELVDDDEVIPEDDDDHVDDGEAAPALLLVGLGKTYGDLPALHPIDLVIPAGQAVALIGHNGSGKSTLLRMVSGLLEPTEGEVEIAGWPVGSVPARATTSFLPDEPVLYDDLSVREHVEYVSRLHGGEGWDDYAEDVAVRLGLGERLDDLPARFSRGLRQKTSLLLGIVRPFSVLLVDEPFVGLDAPGKATLLELLDEIHGDGAAVVVATHDPEFVERVDRSIALRDGELIFDGQATVGEVLRLVSA